MEALPRREGNQPRAVLDGQWVVGCQMTCTLHKCEGDISPSWLTSHIEHPVPFYRNMQQHNNV
jgi:hypothetical protein